MRNLDAILKIQDEFLDLADRFDVPIVDNVTIDGSVLLIIRHVIETLRRHGQVEGAEPGLKRAAACRGSGKAPGTVYPGVEP